MDRSQGNDLNSWLPVIQLSCPACGSAEEAVVRATEGQLGEVLARFFGQHLGGGKRLEIQATGRFVLPAPAGLAASGS